MKRTALQVLEDITSNLLDLARYVLSSSESREFQCKTILAIMDDLREYAEQKGIEL